MANVYTTIIPTLTYTKMAVNTAVNYYRNSTIAKPPPGASIIRSRSIGDLVADVTVEEKHTDTVQVTEHPVQNGSVIADHAINMPRQVTITGGWTDATGETTGVSYSTEMYDALLELMRTREPIDIQTGKRLYQNMEIISCISTTDKNTENSFVFTIEAREVIITETQVVSVPASAQKRASVTQAKQQMGEKTVQKTILAAGTGQGRVGGAIKLGDLF